MHIYFIWEKIFMQIQKQKLGIDLDGTVAGSVEIYFKHFARQGQSRNAEASAPNRGLISKTLSLRNESVTEAFSQIWSQWRSIPLINERIPDYVNMLSKRYDVKIVTATSGSDSDVKKWLDSKNFGQIEVVFAQDCKKEAHCDILVDDMAYFVNRMVKSGKRGVMINQPWSAGPSNDVLDHRVEVFKNWGGICSALNR